MTKIVYKELSYKIVGVLFEVHNKLGSQYQEKYYQRAVEEALKNQKISYQKEIKVDLTFKGNKIGKYFLDFLIENKVILEIKAKPFIEKEDIRQVLSYLRTAELELGIIANFRSSKLVYKRILNPEVRSSE